MIDKMHDSQRSVDCISIWQFSADFHDVIRDIHAYRFSLKGGTQFPSDFINVVFQFIRDCVFERQSVVGDCSVFINGDSDLQGRQPCGHHLTDVPYRNGIFTSVDGILI